MVFHQTLASDNRLGVGGKDLFRLAHRVLKLECRIFARQGIGTDLLLKLRCKLAHQALVQLPAADLVGLLAEHMQLATDKLHDRDGENRVAHGTEGNNHRLLRVKVARAVDAVCQCGRGVLVHDPQNREVRDPCRVQHRLALGVGER
mmetsp:Transcript_121487/g.349104  ORF Transcript_121487/g.349104 Transcript_121487/m.349104 type:complete len:147 (-) Transcript_121487:479-919(-)